MSELRKRIEGLTPDQLSLLKLQVRRESRDDAGENSENARISAYLVGTGILEDAIREQLTRILPEYMIPAKIVEVERIPRLPNGKVDFKSLQEDCPDDVTRRAPQDESAPSTEVEKKLTKIWETVLRSKRIGVNDNFFEIGGDSILSIRIVGLARKEGIVLEPNQLFENQTIAELARAAVIETPKAPVSRAGEGDVELTPIQHWFFEEHVNAPNFWNLAVEFVLPKAVNRRVTEKAVAIITERHDALRLRFTSDSGTWKSLISNEKGLQLQTFVDLSGYPEDEVEMEIGKRSDAVGASLDLAKDSLFRSVYFTNSDVRPDRLVLIAHHLLVDSYSWDVLSREFVEICDALAKNRVPKIESATTSFAEWSRHLGQLSRSESVASELGFWKEQLTGNLGIKTDFKKELPLLEKDIESTEFALDRVVADILINKIPKTANLRPKEILVTALLRTLREMTGETNFSISFEVHGRQTSGVDIDLSNSVGWFTSYFPLRLEYEPDADIFINSEYVKERLRGTPNAGIGYGLLRYMSSDPAIRRSLEFRPEIIFNYLGSRDQFANNQSDDVRALTTGMRDPSSERSYLLEFNTFVVNGKLLVRCAFSGKQYRTETIDSLMRGMESSLREIIEISISSERRSYTPSDFPEADMDQKDLDNLLGDLTQ